MRMMTIPCRMRLACCAAMAVLMTPTLLLANTIELDVAVHEAMQKAKKAGRSKVLVVTREDYRSEEDQNLPKGLSALEQIAVRGIKAEKLEAVTSKPATELARKYKARRGLRPSELIKFRSHGEFDAVLTLDYKSLGNRLSIRVSLVDAQKPLFNDYVNLDKVPEEEKKTDKKPATKKKPIPGRQIPMRPASGPDPTTLPRPASGATGYLISRPNAGRLVRSTQRRIKGQDREGRPSNRDGNNPPARDASGDSETAEARPQQTKSDTEGDSQGKPNDDDEATEETQAIRAQNLQVGEIGRGILNFATENIGKKVGNGQCWTLAAEAMKAAGAEPPKGYTYGEKVDLSDVRPGDILQFKTARFDEPGYWAIMGSPDHTAVVQSVGAERIFMLHQNFNGKKIVGPFDINPNNMTSGRMEVWRPVPRMPR